MPYVVLAAAGLLAFGVSWRVKPLQAKIALLLVAGAAVGSADWLVFGVLRLYDYRPGLLLDPELDARLGVLLAEYLFIPGITASLAPVVPRHKWAVLAEAALMMALEILFLRMGIFMHKGWNLWFSAFLFFAFFALAHTLAALLVARPYAGFGRLVLIASAANYSWHIEALVSHGLLGLWSIEPRIMAKAVVDGPVGALLLEGVPFMVLTCFGVWHGWTRKLPPLLLLGGGLALWFQMLSWLGIWHDRVSAGPLIDGLVLAVLAGVVGQIDAWFAATAKAGAPG